jgi:PelA/Pel-15E family pectate lyase
LALDVAASAAATPAPRFWEPDPDLPVTAERIARLPGGAQAAWRAYLEASRARARLLPALSTREPIPAFPRPAPTPGGRHSKGVRLEAAPAWYASEEARAMADRVVERQTAVGAWTKGNDYTKPAPPDEAIDVWSRGTLDNDATTSEMRFLALVGAAAPEERARPWRAAFLRALDYLFGAQYPNGGFPQIYPLAGGYHDAITYNDSAMTHALEVLRDVADRRSDLAFVAEAQRAEAERRLRLGLECILATQLRTPDGRRTAWGQQYDALTLRPCAARNFEPIAACTRESVPLIHLLLSLSDRSPAVSGAIDDALAWFVRVALREVTWDRRLEQGSGLVPTPGAPLLWARLYEIETDTPIFGDRDRSIHYAVTEISAERRIGYTWYGDWPQALLDARKSPPAR